MCVGAGAVAFASQKLSGGLLTFAWYFLICGLAIVAGVVVLIVERFLSIQIFDALTPEEQVAICEKQAKYMNKRQRRRQVHRLGDDARVDTGNGDSADTKRNDKKRRSKKSKGKQVDADGVVDARIEPVEPADAPREEE